MPVVLAGLPILAVIGALTWLKWQAWAAGLLGLAVAIAVAIGPFGFAPQAMAAPPLLAGSLAEAGFVTLTILWIIFPALCIYELQERSGALAVITKSLARLTSEPRLQVLLVAWFFGMFMEGVAGFGTPIALAAPILVVLGYAPHRAVTIALVGHAAGVSFGAVGTPVLTQMQLTDLPGLVLSQPPALLHALLGWALAVVVFVIASDERPRIADLAWPLLAAVCFFVPSLLLAWFAGPELPTLGGALVGGVVFALVLMRRGGSSGGSVDLPALLRAALPYIVLLALILVSRLVPPVQHALRQVSLHWTLFGEFSGHMEVLYHPGTLLLAGFVGGGLLQGRPWRELADAMVGAAIRLPLVALALLAMLALSRLMVHALMIQTLAEGAAATGGAWPLLSPMVGVLGSFVTGSATSSNILFTTFQQVTANALGLAVPLMLGAQTFGAAIGNIIAPHNIIAGAATVGNADGAESRILRTTLVVCLVYALAGGGLNLLLSGG